MSLATDLISYWKLNEASGNALDSHGSNELVETSGTIDAATGKVYATARDFEAGDTEYFAIADNADLSTGDIDFTFACWIKLESNSRVNPVLGKFDANGQLEYLLRIATSNRPEWYVSNDGTNLAVASPAGTLGTGTWFHLLVYHDSVNNLIGCSINNAAPTTAAHSTGVRDGTSGFKLGIQFRDSLYYDGLIEGVGFWKRLLTDDEKTALYNSGNGLSYDLFDLPVNTVAPAVTGDALLGATLTSDNGTFTAEDDSFTYTYQWQRAETVGFGTPIAISGETASTFANTASLIGRFVRCAVTATNGSGSTTAYSNVIGPIGLSAATPSAATGPKHAKYDDAATGNLTRAFYRNQATVDGQAVVRAADQRRFGKGVGYAPATAWADTGLNITSSGAVRILGGGVDFDNETPIVVTWAATANQIKVFKGEAFTLQNTTTWTATWITDQPGSTTYYPRGCVVHHGFIALLCERSVSGTVKGVSIVYSQDYGATWTGVPVQGESGFDVPVIAGDVSSGKARGETWSFSAFPVTGITDIRAAFLPWADYQHGGTSCKGGQAGLFRIDRASDTGTWTVSNNRLAYEDWDADWLSAGNIHFHTTAITTGGLLVHIGDNDDRNRMVYVDLDLDNYATATATPTTVFGGYDVTSAQFARHAQPTAAVPSPTLGGHIAASDFGCERLIYFGPMSSASDDVEARALVYRVAAFPGNTGNSLEALHLHWCYGHGWIAPSLSGTLTDCLYSRDGVNWADVSLPAAAVAGARICIAGNWMVSHDSSRNIIRAPLPSFEAVKPLQISRGVTNLLAEAADWAFQTATATDNDWTQVYYDGTNWRYIGDDSLLEEQPEAPPFSHDVPVWLWESDSASSRVMGNRYLQASGQTISNAGKARCSVWVCNLGDRGSTLKFNLATGASGQSSDGELGYLLGTRGEWNPATVNQTPENTDRARLNCFSAASSTLNSGLRALVAIAGLHDNHTLPTYPTPPLTTLPPNEIESLSNFLCGTAWTLGLVWQAPENVGQIWAAEERVIATLLGDEDHCIRIVQAITNIQLGELRVELVSGGSVVDTLVIGDDASTNMYPGEVAELIISSDGADTWIAGRNGRWPVLTDSSEEAVSQAFNHLVFANENFLPTSCNPILAFVNGKKAYTEEEQAAWLAGTLAAKRGSSGQQLIGGQIVGSPIVGQQIVGNKLVY